jgi:hypothetical protein
MLQKQSLLYSKQTTTFIKGSSTGFAWLVRYKLQSRVPELKRQLGLSQNLGLQNSTTLNIGSSI